jgi:hypothetical protein
MTDAETIELNEKETRIRQMMADIMLKELDSVKRWQDIRYAPFVMLATGAGGIAALAAAFTALGAFIAKWPAH